MQELTPREVVAHLDRYVVGQDEAKRAVAVAIRNRIRRQRLDPELARDAKAMSTQVESTFEKAFEALLVEGEKGSRPIRDLFALLVIFTAYLH